MPDCGDIRGGVSLVESRLLSLCTLKGQASGRNIGNLILEALASFHIYRPQLCSVCCDNANVMLGKENGVAAVLMEVQENLIKIGSACHLINLAAEKGALCLPTKVDEVRVDRYNYLEKCATRKETLRQFQEIHDAEFRKILKHAPTRWLSLGKCLTRLLDQWKPLLSFFLHEVKGKRSPSFLDSYQIPKAASKASNSSSREA